MLYWNEDEPVVLSRPGAGTQGRARAASAGADGLEPAEADRVSAELAPLLASFLAAKPRHWTSEVAEELFVRGRAVKG